MTEPKISMTKSKLEDILNASALVAPLLLAVEGIKEHETIVGVPTEKVVAAVDEFIVLVRKSLREGIEGLDDE